jgi:hypothetical protein
MKVTLDVEAGWHKVDKTPTKRLMRRNIDAINHVLELKSLTIADIQCLIDTKSILLGIQEQLPD